MANTYLSPPDDDGGYWNVCEISRRVVRGEVESAQELLSAIIEACLDSFVARQTERMREEIRG